MPLNFELDGQTFYGIPVDSWTSKRREMKKVVWRKGSFEIGRTLGACDQVAFILGFAIRATKELEAGWCPFVIGTCLQTPGIKTSITARQLV